LREYNEDIDKAIIDILFKKEERTSGKLKEDLEKSIKHTISFETYSYRLKSMLKPHRDESKYTIGPILNKIDEGRGKNVTYSLTRDTKTRYTLELPILKTDSNIEKAYRLLFYYIVFCYNSNRKLKNVDEYNTLLEKLYINKNELEILPTSDFNQFKITKWTHPESEIEFTRKDIPQPSGTKEISEYSYMLPGISPLEFHTIKESRLPYQPLNLTQDKVTQYFELLEKHKLIDRIKLKELEYLNEERYTIVDNSLKTLLADCWSLQNHTFTYFEYYWKSVSKPTNEEKIWFEHLWGKNRSNQWFIECNTRRREYHKENNNQLLPETQERIDWEKSEIRKTFDSIEKEHAETIKDYSYFIHPLLNVIYPEFLRKEFNNN
jgi:hypothetical protein